VSAETPAEAARRHLAAGRQPVLLKKKGKAPASAGAWQHVRYRPQDIDAVFTPESNVGLLLGPDSGNLVDIDCDCPEAIQFALVYLPPTMMIHGRPSAPLAHFWYTVDEPIDLVKYTDGNKTIIEFRCSKGDKGFQTVIPPSIHPSGEQLSWARDAGPGHVRTETLLAWVRIIAAGAILARHFPLQGQRHEFCLALAGAMLRYGTPEEDAYHFVHNVARIGGSTDPAARAAVVRSTARKLAEGSGDTTGIPRLMEIVGDEKAIKKVCELLELRDDAGDALLKLNEKMGYSNALLGSEAPQQPALPAHDATPGAPPVQLGKVINLFGGSAGAPPPPPPPGRAGVDPDDETTPEDQKLKTKKDGSAVPCGDNVYKVLRYASVTRGHFRFDNVEKKLVVTGYFGSVDESVLDIVVTDWILRNMDLDVPKQMVADRIARVAMENKFDPICDRLLSLRWDGVDRLSTWLKVYVGAEDGIEGGPPDGYLAFVGTKWFVSLVARGLNPGCKADLVLILQGLQGTGKTSLLRIIGGKWYADLTVHLGDKDAKMLNLGAWLAELPDLAALKKTSEVNAVKAFFSAQEDRFRPPYGKSVISAPRRTVYAGTINPTHTGYLSDVTGNRRFACVDTGVVDLEAFTRDVDQILAQAVHLYQRHVNFCDNKLKCCCWWPTVEEAKIIEQEASKQVEDPPASETISKWWLSLATEQRPTQFTVSDIAIKALKLDVGKIDQKIRSEIGSALQGLGFVRKHGVVPGQIKRCWYYVPTKHLLDLLQVDSNMAVRVTRAVEKNVGSN
jgi:hypothetical protein